jgi:hypothetical protein
MDIATPCPFASVLRMRKRFSCALKNAPSELSPASKDVLRPVLPQTWTSLAAKLEATASFYGSGATLVEKLCNVTP